MDVNGLKALFFSICENFFNGTNIMWVGEGSETPPLPLITLRTDTLNKATFPFDEGFNEDGQFIEYYNADIMLEVKAYSKGYVGNVEEGVIQTAENTAMNDMQQFADYIASQGMIEQLGKYKVNMIQEGPVRDTSVVKSGSRYEYSAMVEYKVNFILETSGVYAVSSQSSQIEKNTLIKTIPEGIQEELGYFETVNEIEGKLQ